MDMIVTTPKTRMAEAAKEAADAIADSGLSHYCLRFPLKHQPQLAANDRIYYVEDGYVRGFAVVHWLGWQSEEEHSGDSGTPCRPGFSVYMKTNSWQWITPIPMKGFRGFRYARGYFLREQVQVIGNWRDPKPTTSFACPPNPEGLCVAGDRP